MQRYLVLIVQQSRLKATKGDLTMKHHDIALVIIDMQNDFVLPDSPACVKGAYRTIPRIQEVLYYFRAKQWPVFHVVREYREDGSNIEHTRLEGFLKGFKPAVPGTKGCEVVNEIMPIAGEYRVVKWRFSGFMGTELDFILRRLGVKNLVMCGTQYPNCIRATVYDAVSLEYNVTLITDATSAQSDEIAEANIKDIQNIDVKCIDFERWKNAR
jgi:nicotinamidase-related amidase